ncbi:hypothetical protein [Amycolatopsis sp. H20-H5]|uniref:hypothetical protein n=1 Tax=Amycolatopsis sp. H20-H5 TaxID=3046309 RepID=UPI002DB5B4B4|nr:hypothetical protein [Amycolatopsis sp. H20-H5]MEC3974740.1 hypothetical protein [Amycolatopsis sp. H20-H5]
MWALATCRATIYRATTQDPDYGNPVPDNTTPLHSNVLASIVEWRSAVWDPATQTPRVVRNVKGTVPSTTDIRTGDRIRDGSTGALYAVQNVTRPHAPGRTPDVELELKRVGGDGG